MSKYPDEIALDKADMALVVDALIGGVTHALVAGDIRWALALQRHIDAIKARWPEGETTYPEHTRLQRDDYVDLLVDLAIASGRFALQGNMRMALAMDIALRLIDSYLT